MSLKKNKIIMKKLLKMYKIIYLFIITFFLLIFSGCKNQPEENVTYITSFPEKKEVVAKEIKWIEPYMISNMLQIDSLLIICNTKGAHVFQIYNTNTKTLLKECGSFGRGPN